jgi:uncharacterized membrane protein (UPF0127 family)
LATKTKLIVNLSSGDQVCVGEVADGPLKRMRGLLGRRGLSSGEGMLLVPAPSIHTAFMRFPIDALFLDRELRVLDIVERLRPWRMASRHRARCVLELAAGESARRGIRVGDRLGLRERGVAAIGARSPGRGGTVSGSESIIWPDARLRGALQQDPSVRVLIASPDRQFRSATAMLLVNRGCSVTTTSSPHRVVELVVRDAIDVVVVDSHERPSAAAVTIATVSALARPASVVMVGESPAGEAQVPVLEKWGPFEDLYDAIKRASRTDTARKAGA